MESDGSMPHLDQVRDDVVYMLYVSLSWGDSETRHGHNGSGDVNLAQGYRPLKHADECW